MASESTGEQTVSVTLPSELHDWLEDHAGELDIDRETLLVQLAASYRKTAELDGDGVETVAVSEGEIAEFVREQLDDRLQRAVQERTDAIVTERVNEATNGVQRQLGNRIDSVENEFQSKLEDVRNRVIQIKKEADSKAPGDHTHEEFHTLEELAEQVGTLEAEVGTLRSEFDGTVSDHEEMHRELDERLETVHERLQTVAWVVSDLRDAHESGTGLEAVERIKRAAAKEDIERAACENCGEKVSLALLTDPECPHCSATVTDVEPGSGWFGKPTLRAATQLESGETQ
jgi:hypothetical protein